jgi:uncharacterized protein YqjF (DUF2071 family)
MRREFLDRTDHRPFPLPEAPWVLSQSWSKLLFAHWSVSPDTLRAQIPADLEIDLFDGKAWIGVVPFAMREVGPRYLPKPSGISNFLELNVRTYVIHQGRPGVYFFSLDCSSRFAVWVAKTFYHLPYFNASMSLSEKDGWIEYESVRKDGLNSFSARYRGTGENVPSQSGSIDHFLTERYCLYTTSRGGRIHQGIIHHDRWPLQKAEAQIKINTMTAPTLGFELPAQEPLLHYSENIDTVEWPLRLVV